MTPIEIRELHTNTSNTTTTPMKTFPITITCMVPATTIVHIEADSQEEAESFATAHLNTLRWKSPFWTDHKYAPDFTKAEDLAVKLTQ